MTITYNNTYNDIDAITILLALLESREKIRIVVFVRKQETITIMGERQARASAFYNVTVGADIKCREECALHSQVLHLAAFITVKTKLPHILRGKGSRIVPLPLLEFYLSRLNYFTRERFFLALEVAPGHSRSTFLLSPHPSVPPASDILRHKRDHRDWSGIREDR
jgi:hypothetical protein